MYSLYLQKRVVPSAFDVSSDFLDSRSKVVRPDTHQAEGE